MEQSFFKMGHLDLCASSAEGVGSTHDRGTPMTNAVQYGKKKKEKLFQQVDHSVGLRGWNKFSRP